MRIAFTAADRHPETTLDPRFGRAPFFLIYDTDTADWTSLGNPAVESLQGAGTQAAEALVRAGVAALVTGQCGPKAHRALTAAGIEVYTSTEGTVVGSLAAFAAGRLSTIQAGQQGGTGRPHSGGGREGQTR